MAGMKIIKDLVHGYIELSSEACKIVDTPSFQRLKHISQLTATHLYPSANHTRFEHSLGVMHLALTFYQQIKNQIRELCVKDEYFRRIGLHNGLDVYKNHLQFASLLHDIGHAPLSHVGELFYDKNAIIENIKIKLASNKHLELSNDIYEAGSAHELMSCYIILENYYELLKQVGISDFDFILRLITGAKYRNDWLKNVLIDILNSKTLDVDKIDYLLRDNYMCGYVGPVIDIERLVKSLSIDTLKELSFDSIGLSSLLSVIESRDWLYLWVYNHHTTVYTDFLYKDCLDHFNELRKHQGQFEEKINLDDYFSCDAIGNKLVNDNHIYSLLYSAREAIKNGRSSQRTKKLIPQIIERKFLKPVWKTLSEYKQFMKRNFNDDKTIDRIIIDILDNEYKFRSKIVKLILKSCDLNHGDVFIICRSNKFYFMDENCEFYINLGPDKESCRLREVFPQRDYSDHFGKISFYLFCCADKFEKVVTEFIKILKTSKYKE